MEEVEALGAEVQEIAVPETTESRQEEQPVQKLESPTAEDKQNYAFAKMRREKEELERKARMQEELLQRLMSQQQPAQVQNQPEEDIIGELSKEEYVPGEKVAKGLRKLKDDFDKQLQALKNQHQQKEYSDAFSELRRDMPDFDEVVNPETLAIVKEKNPRLANSWSKLDDYSIAVQAYPYIKNSGILDEVPGARRAKEIDKKIEQNKKTVQSPQAFDKRPMAQAFNYENLSKTQKEELQSEMNRFSRLAGGGY